MGLVSHRLSIAPGMKKAVRGSSVPVERKAGRFRPGKAVRGNSLLGFAVIAQLSSEFVYRGREGDFVQRGFVSMQVSRRT